MDFPQYLDVGGANASPDFDAIFRGLLALRRPQDITEEHAKWFNIQIASSQIAASDIIPEDARAGLPPLPWESAEQPEGDAAPKMGNGLPYPPREKYDVCDKELRYNNDDAFREIGRMEPRPGRSRVRLTQSRKFWTGLEKIALYWDTELDQYYDRPAQPDSSSSTTEDKEQMKDDPESNTDAMEVDGAATDKPKFERVYKGRRIGAGQDMPETNREEAIRGLMEMAAWPFMCQIVMPTLPPRLSVRNLLFPVRQSLVAGRAPRERDLARKGILEGPLLLAQCRNEVAFREPGEAPGRGKLEQCDLIREVGAMLLTAQERAREGTVEVRPGEGKWWTTVPRWGGAPDEGVTGDAAQEEPAENSGNGDERSPEKRPRRSFSSRRLGSSQRKLSTSERWKQLQPGSSLWDKKMRYMQIGKVKDSPFDDVCYEPSR